MTEGESLFADAAERSSRLRRKCSSLTHGERHAVSRVTLTVRSLISTALMFHAGLKYRLVRFAVRSAEANSVRPN